MTQVHFAADLVFASQAPNLTIDHRWASLACPFNEKNSDNARREQHPSFAMFSLPTDLAYFDEQKPRAEPREKRVSRAHQGRSQLKPAKSMVPVVSSPCKCPAI